tara:strand:+ start:3562 stop:3933 length:372 start_codon:yes stop_codon:yes gene_type:complete
MTNNNDLVNFFFGKEELTNVGNPPMSDASVSFKLFDVPADHGDHLMNQVKDALKNAETYEGVLELYPTCSAYAKTPDEVLWVTYLFGMHCMAIRQATLMAAARRVVKGGRSSGLQGLLDSLSD